MQYKNTLEAIYIEINELQQNIATWGVEDQIRNIDIDLALAKLRDVYDSLLSLKGEKLIIAKGSTDSDIIEKKKEKDLEVEIETEAKAETELETPESQSLKNEIEFVISGGVEIEDVAKEEVEEESSEAKHENVIISESDSNKEPYTDEKTSLSDKYINNRPTLNEELSSQVSSEDLARNLKNRPITNLSSAIGLNEKFEFINNLFNGDKEKYEEVIETLNMATNFNEAYNFLSSKLNWDMSNPMVQRILELIRRKLIVNKNEQ